MHTAEQLLEGSIIGVVDSYGAAHSRFLISGSVAFHEQFWPECHHVRWRWCPRQSIWWVTDETRPNDEEYEAIQRHLTRTYGLKWWENGHHDIDDLMARNEKEQKKLAPNVKK